MNYSLSLDFLEAHAAAKDGETYDLVDKSQWPIGPWTKEPDLVVFKHRGFWCMVCRHSLQGTLNGYLRLPAGHPWHGGNYHDYEHPIAHVRVHGGFTLAERADSKTDDGWMVSRIRLRTLM